MPVDSSVAASAMSDWEEDTKRWVTDPALLEKERQKAEARTDSSAAEHRSPATSSGRLSSFGVVQKDRAGPARRISLRGAESTSEDVPTRQIAVIPDEYSAPDSVPESTDGEVWSSQALAVAAPSNEVAHSERRDADASGAHHRLVPRLDSQSDESAMEHRVTLMIDEDEAPVFVDRAKVKMVYDRFANIVGPAAKTLFEADLRAMGATPSRLTSIGLMRLVTRLGRKIPVSAARDQFEQNALKGIIDER